MDDYSLLQNIKADDLNKTATIFPIKNGLVFHQSTPYGHKEKSFQGESFYTAPNPAIGATIYYFLKDDFKSIKDKRQESEKEKIKNNKDVYYPPADSIRLEDTEEAAYILATISDELGNDVRKINLPAKKGLARFVWNGRYDVSSPVNFNEVDESNPYYSADEGPVAIPGKYFIKLDKMQNGTIQNMVEKTAFTISTLENATLPLPDRQKLLAYNKELSEFRRVVLGTEDYFGLLKEKIKYLKKGVVNGNVNAVGLLADIHTFETKKKTIDMALHGDESLAKREFETLPRFCWCFRRYCKWQLGATYGRNTNNDR